MDAFLKLIDKDFNRYHKFIMKNKLFDNIKIKIANFILYSPNKNNSFINSFEEVYPYKIDEYREILKKIYNEFNIYDENLVYTNEHIDELHLKRIQESLSNKINFIYLYRNGKHLTNLVNKVRNSLAHGNFYILDNRIVMWNISINKNVTFFANLSMKNFKFFHDTVIKMILK